MSHDVWEQLNAESALGYLVVRARLAYAATMLRVLLMVTLPAFFSCATLRPECKSHGGTPWFQVETRHFTVQTNLDADKAQAAALDLEKSLVALRSVFPEDREPPGRIEALIFRNNSQFEDITGLRTAEGVWFQTWNGSLLAMGSASFLFGAQAKSEVLMHELTHHVSLHALARQPRWLVEGLAKYLEGTQIERDTAHWGDVNSAELEILNDTGPLAFESLWEWNSPFSSDRTLTDRRYATSWLFVHYFYNHRAKQFARYLEALANDLPPRAAFAEAFDGVAGATLDNEVKAYLSAGQYEVAIVPLNDFAHQVHQRPLSDGEVHVALARVAGTQERRRSEIKAALELAPSWPGALIMQVLYETEPARQRALASAFTQAHPDNADGWRLLGQVLSHNADQQNESIAAFRKAHSIDPSNVRVTEELGHELFYLEALEEAVPLLREAIKLQPNRPFAAMHLALALARTHACEEAEYMLEHATELFSEQVDLNKAKELLTRTSRAVQECGPKKP